MVRMGKPGDLTNHPGIAQAFADQRKEAAERRSEWAKQHPTRAQWKILGGDAVIAKMDELDAWVYSDEGKSYGENADAEKWLRLRNWLEANAA